MDFRAFAFSKNERVCRKKNVETLFKGKESRSLVAFPLRAVFVTEDTECKEDCPQAQVLVSVSKRRLRHAVDRNRAKRLIRETYRKARHILIDGNVLAEKQRITIAFLWIDSHLYDYNHVEKAMFNILHRIREKMQE